MASQSLLDCSDAAGLVNSMSVIAVNNERNRQSAAKKKRTVHAELVERPSNFDLGFEIKVGIGELLAFA
jgi:hypothetical protein